MTVVDEWLRTVTFQAFEEIARETAADVILSVIPAEEAQDTLTGQLYMKLVKEKIAFSKFTVWPDGPHWNLQFAAYSEWHRFTVRRNLP